MSRHVARYRLADIVELFGDFVSSCIVTLSRVLVGASLIALVLVLVLVLLLVPLLALVLVLVLVFFAPVLIVILRVSPCSCPCSCSCPCPCPCPCSCPSSSPCSCSLLDRVLDRLRLYGSRLWIEINGTRTTKKESWSIARPSRTPGKNVEPSSVIPWPWHWTHTDNNRTRSVYESRREALREEAGSHEYDRPNSGWTERALDQNFICHERRSGKRNRSSETAAESVHDERTRCGWRCLSDRWDSAPLDISLPHSSLSIPFSFSLPSLVSLSFSHTPILPLPFESFDQMAHLRPSGLRIDYTRSTCVRSIKEKLLPIFRIETRDRIAVSRLDLFSPSALRHHSNFNPDRIAV